MITENIRVSGFIRNIRISRIFEEFFRIFGEFLGFLEILVVLGFYLVLREEVSEFGHSGSTEKIGILEDFRFFEDILRIFPKIYIENGISGFFRNIISAAHLNINLSVIFRI
jgi:hypothetical protein